MDESQEALTACLRRGLPSRLACKQTDSSDNDAELAHVLGIIRVPWSITLVRQEWARFLLDLEVWIIEVLDIVRVVAAKSQHDLSTMLRDKKAASSC